MNQQQGDELIEAMAKETGLNPVLCAQWLALMNAHLHCMGVTRRTWTLAAWRASNAEETLAVMKQPSQPAEDDAALRDRLVAEAAFHHLRGLDGQGDTGREVNIFFDAYCIGWNAARANQKAGA